MASHPFQNFMVRYGGNERIFTEGDLATNMYIVQSGKIRMFRIMDDEKRILGTMEKGDFFGEMSILEGLPRTFSAEALEDVELIEINSMTFDKMIKCIDQRNRSFKRFRFSGQPQGGHHPRVASTKHDNIFCFDRHILPLRLIRVCTFAVYFSVNIKPALKVQRLIGFIL